MSKVAPASCCLLALLTAACQPSGHSTAQARIQTELAARSERGARAAELVRSSLRLYHEHKYDAAAKDLTRATDMAPQNAQAWMALGAVKFAQQSWFDAAQAFDKAAKLLPDRFEPHFNLGTVLEAAGVYKAAIREYTIALALAPQDLTTEENLARCLISNNTDLPRARALIASALEHELRGEWRQWLERQGNILDNNLATTRPLPSAPATQGAPDAH
jgi:tetratricopeptide (TPR) repeat protein